MTMSDLIDREQALKALEEISYALWEVDIPSPTVPEYIEHHRDVQKVMGIADMWARKIMALPSAEKTGKWENIDIIHDRKDAKITDWQQAQCSVCGKWQTKPYLYGIYLDPYCPSCGARMVKE